MSEPLQDEPDRIRERRESGTTDDQPAVVVEGLTKEYADVRALDGVSFTVGEGEVVGLLGPNGAGKTTCIKSLLGLIEPTAGRAEVAGIDVTSDRTRAYRHIGAMLEGARNVYWRLTVRENLAFFAGLAGHDPDRLRPRHDELLDRLGLAQKGDVPVRDLSRGMKQKVAIAATLSRDIDVAFLDEPTLGLDVESSLDLQRELRALVQEENLTVLLSSHDMDVIRALCDRVVVLADGTVVADDTIDALLEVFRSESYRVVVDGIPPDELRTRLAERYDLHEWDAADGTTRIEVQLADGNEIADLTTALVDRGQDIRSVTAVEPDLEEAFLQLTDRRNR